MIISYSRKFVYLRTIKVASSSLEFYFSQFCDSLDVITPLLASEEKQKKQYKLPLNQNFKFLKLSLSIKNILKFRIYKKKRIDEHSTIDTVFKTHISKNIHNFFFFSFVRNPFDWIISYFWWDLHYHQKKTVFYINGLSPKKIQIIFKKFLKKECKEFFRRNKKIISSKHVRIKVYKLENLQKSIIKIKKKLKIKDEKINIFKINLKSLKINNKIKLDKNDHKLILNCASFFFKNYNYPKKVPSKYQ